MGRFKSEVLPQNRQLPVTEFPSPSSHSSVKTVYSSSTVIVYNRLYNLIVSLYFCLCAPQPLKFGAAVGSSDDATGIS